MQNKLLTDSEATRESLDRAFAAGIDGVVGDSLCLSADAAQHHQTAAVREMLECLLRDQKLPTGVDGKNTIEFFRGDLADMSKRFHPRIGHHDIQVTIMLHCLLKHTGDLDRFGHIGFDGNSLASHLLNFLDDGFRKAGRTGVIDHDGGTTAG